MIPLFEEYTKEMYEHEGIRFIEPMLAKELDSEEKQDEAFNNLGYYIEEKFDGTRSTLHVFDNAVRCFSRRVSEKTGWLCENSDSLPHIRDLDIPELSGTILDGEMFIPNRPFKDVSSTLNCNWDKAIERQESLGKICFHAFDILYYKGIRVEMLPLHRRKVYLRKAIEAINSEYVKNVSYYRCGAYLSEEDLHHGVQAVPFVKERHKNFSQFMIDLFNMKDKFSELYKVCAGNSNLTPRAFYEFIVATGGEGVIVKPKEGKYYYKRGWEYSKIKKFLTRDVIIIGYSDPTEEYKGKFPTIEKWDYWITSEGDVVDLSDLSPEHRTIFKKNWYPDECAPVSKFFANQWVGNIRFGVIVTQEEIDRLPKNKEFNIIDTLIENTLILEVGECAGYDEEMREYITDNKDKLLGTVVEVKANELFKDTGKLRHPRFFRLRPDKLYKECKWADHVNEEVL